MSHPIWSLAQAYVYREQCQPFGIYADGKRIGNVSLHWNLHRNFVSFADGISVPYLAGRDLISAARKSL